MLDWAALNTVSIACPHGDLLPERSRRHDYAAAAVAEEDVRAVGFGEPRRAFEEFFGIHDVDQIEISDVEKKFGESPASH